VVVECGINTEPVSEVRADIIREIVKRAMNPKAIITWVLIMVAIPNVTAAQIAELNLKAASFQGEQVVFAKPFYRWVAEANRRCRGKLAIDVVGPKSIKSELQWLELRDGRIDVYFGPASYYRGELGEADALNLAKVNPAKQRRNGAWEILNKIHNKKLNAWYLTTLIAGVKFYIYTTKPAKNGRFDGLRLRAVPLYQIFVENLGAITTYLPATEIGTALENGTLDGLGWPLWGLEYFGWEKLLRYRYGPGFMDTAAPVLVNLDRWNSLSKQQKQCLNDMAAWAEQVDPLWRAEEDARQLDLLEQAKIEYVDLGHEFALGTEKIFWNMLRTASPDFAQKIRPLIE
jgi:TRAP-type C4-dicarboxylate transport system substrate-binding protein